MVASEREFDPILSTLPAPQRRPWPELSATSAQFTHDDGTALALRLGHRSSVDFDLFSNDHLDPHRLDRAAPYLHGSDS
jgi:hypothetical protein